MSGLTINTSYTNLVSSNNLSRTVSRINETMTQLATGVAVTPKSDPAAFIASTMMESDIIAGNQAIKNAQLDNAVLNIAESGMSQITSLLQEAKGLSVAAANSGANTPAMNAAYQQQMDAILGSVDRIARTTNYMGIPLLDGSYNRTAQLGTDVVSQQQAPLTIPNMQTTALGGADGYLAQLAAGGKTPLWSNPMTASSIIDQSLSQVLTARAQTGSTQKYTLDTAMEFMEDYMTQLTGAKSAISDTNFAIAASNLARDSLLMQTGTKALGLSSQNAAYAASLLQ